MVLSSNEWSQMDETGLMASSGRGAMETKPAAASQVQQPLKCPRCDSSNTKFCYYNNYSLSQPRHFCKACKRYWTRGGTLRNVPVGGGYRKNKRAKRPTAVATGDSTATAPPLPKPAPAPPVHQINISGSNHVNSLLYGIPNNLSYTHHDFPFRKFQSTASGVENIPTSCTSTGYDHHDQYYSHQMSSLGLNFPSATWARDGIPHQDNGFEHSTSGCGNQMQDMVSSSNSILSSLSLPGYSSSTSARSTVSLLSSGLQKQKLVFGGLKDDIRPSSNLQAFLSLEGMQMAGGCGDMGMIAKEVKSEDSENNLQIGNKVEHWGLSSQNLIEPLGSSIASVCLNPMSVGAWPDLTN